MAFTMAVYREGDVFPRRELDCDGDSEGEARDDFDGLVETLQPSERARLLCDGLTVAEYSA
jgi:hypothetical protein